jgi:hypothetical protein
MQRDRYIATPQLVAAGLFLVQGIGHAQAVRYVPGKMAIVYDGRQYKSPEAGCTARLKDLDPPLLLEAAGPIQEEGQVGCKGKDAAGETQYDMLSTGVNLEVVCPPFSKKDRSKPHNDVNSCECAEGSGKKCVGYDDPGTDKFGQAAGTANAATPPAVAAGTQKKQACELDKLAAADLKEAIKVRLEAIVNDVNHRLAHNPTLGTQAGPVAGATSARVQESWGWKDYKPGQKILRDAAAARLYGQAIESMTAAAVVADKCLAKHVKHNRSQSKKGDVSPDFLGQGKASGASYDVTTYTSAEIKRRDKRRDGWFFIEYERLLEVDRKGLFVPRK